MYGRVILNNDTSLDGCAFVQENTIWFCSVRKGYTSVNWFTAEKQNGTFKAWHYAGDAFPQSYEVGELHITPDGKEVYFHSSREGGLGGYDIWVTRKGGRHVAGAGERFCVEYIGKRGLALYLPGRARAVVPAHTHGHTGPVPLKEGR